MIFSKIKESGLYEVVSEIRCGILTDHHNTTVINNNILLDKKIKIIYMGTCSEYERPTLLHMRNSAELDSPETVYFYFHTKGLRWFGTDKEKNVVDWINLLIYWNIENWKCAIDKLITYDTYGCNYYKKDGSYPDHYSGNFFWVKNNYVKLLDNYINSGYNDPEFWLCSKSGKYFNVYSSGLEGMGHYNNPFPENIYRSI
jgi:hypothetical protein